MGDQLDEPLTPGTQRSGYKIQKLIGGGSFSHVYLATSPLGQPVALKEGFATSAWRFSWEAEVLAGLRHPQIPQLYECFQTEGCVYLALEYIEAQPLHEFIRQAPQGYLPWRQALQIGADLFEVLSYLHRRAPPVKHDDIKPANILMPLMRKVVLCDFGSANYADGMEFTEEQSEEPYEAPEKERGVSGVLSDLYSMGGVLWELLCGQPPQPQRRFFPTLPQDCPEEITTMLRQLLKLKARHRPSDAGTIRQALLAILQAHPEKQ